MAAPVRSRPGRYLALVGLVLVALYLGVFLGPAQKPALGLDLRGGTEVTLTASPIGGGKVTKEALDQAVTIIRDRVNGLGVGGAEVNTQGSDNIVVQVPGKGHDAVVETVGQTALLTFRQVLTWASGVPTPATKASTSPSPSASASPKAGKGGKTSKSGKSSTTKGKKSAKKASATSSASPSATATSPTSTKKHKSQGDPLSSAVLKSAAKKLASSSPTPAVSPSAAPSATASGSSSASPTASSTASPAATPGNSSGTAAGATVKPLPGSESATLTTAFAKSFSQWNCVKHPNPTMGADDPSFYIIACDPTQGLKYVLAPTAVKGNQVTGASATIDQTSAWVVNVTFNGSGSSAWQALTSKTYDVDNGTADVGSTSCTPPKGCNAAAIVLDGVVQSAPFSETAGGIAGGNTQISGNFTQKTAQDLANTLKYGALPLKFTESDVTSTSATLGAAQLRGGLIAGIIGLGLVVIFSLLYYRALGLVTVGSLLVSGLILYAVTTLLGHSSVGYTLSLPGIAGFIVAVGITADSFVVFFERLRDEIREGRRLRSGVERAWPRARRTIISADFISLLAAFILYLVSIGDVRGFAFTLGLSTLSDLFIVFFFTKPLLTVLARVSAFDSGKTWTGVGKARAGVVRDTVPDRAGRNSRRADAKEA